MRNKNEGQSSSGQPGKRAPWIKPRLTCIVAGSAEAGPNPNAPEGQFAFGS